MCGPGTGGAIDFAQNLVFFNASDLAAQAVHEYRELFAERGRGRRLAMSAAQHWHIGVVARKRLERIHDLAQCGKPHLVHRALHHERVRQVVDVFARAVDVHDFGERLQ